MKRQQAQATVRKEAAQCMAQMMPLLSAGTGNQTVMPQLFDTLLLDMAGQQALAAAHPSRSSTKSPASASKVSPAPSRQINSHHRIAHLTMCGSCHLLLATTAV